MGSFANWLNVLDYMLVAELGVPSHEIYDFDIIVDYYRNGCSPKDTFALLIYGGN